MSKSARTREPELTPVDHAPGVPLYRRVKLELLRLAESGGYPPDRALPNEATLAGSLRVSIGTLRRAVDELVHEHVLVRHQGKGTYVAGHGRDRFLFQFFHVEPRDPGQRGRHEYPQVECVGFERARADEDEASALGLREGDPVFRIGNRLRLGGQPVVYDRLCLSAQLFRGLTERRYVERPSTVYNLYQVDHGITVLRAKERARAVVAGREAARVLGIAPGLPVLEVHRIALSFGEKPVEYRISTIHTRSHDYASVLSKPQA